MADDRLTAATGGQMVLKAAEMMMRKRGRAILCVIVAIAMVMPAVPFSEIGLAFADPSSDQVSTVEDESLSDDLPAAPERINVDVSLGAPRDGA